MATPAAHRTAPAPVTRAHASQLRRRLNAVPPIIRVCLVLSALLILLSLLAPVLAPYDIRAQSLLARLKPPMPLSGYTAAHPLGTDQLGRDVLSRLLFALRTTLGIASLGMLVGMTLGTSLGLLAGLARGKIEELITPFATCRALLSERDCEQLF